MRLFSIIETRIKEILPNRRLFEASMVPPSLKFSGGLRLPDSTRFSLGTELWVDEDEVVDAIDAWQEENNKNFFEHADDIVEAQVDAKLLQKGAKAEQHIIGGHCKSCFKRLDKSLVPGDLSFEMAARLKEEADAVEQHNSIDVKDKNKRRNSWNKLQSIKKTQVHADQRIRGILRENEGCYRCLWTGYGLEDPKIRSDILKPIIDTLVALHTDEIKKMVAIEVTSGSSQELADALLYDSDYMQVIKDRDAKHERNVLDKFYRPSFRYLTKCTKCKKKHAFSQEVNKQISRIDPPEKVHCIKCKAPNEAGKLVSTFHPFTRTEEGEPTFQCQCGEQLELPTKLRWKDAPGQPALHMRKKKSMKALLHGKNPERIGIEDNKAYGLAAFADANLDPKDIEIIIDNYDFDYDTAQKSEVRDTTDDGGGKMRARIGAENLDESSREYYDSKPRSIWELLFKTRMAHYNDVDLIEFLSTDFPLGEDLTKQITDTNWETILIEVIIPLQNLRWQLYADIMVGIIAGDLTRPGGEFAKEVQLKLDKGIKHSSVQKSARKELSDEDFVMFDYKEYEIKTDLKGLKSLLDKFSYQSHESLYDIMIASINDEFMRSKIRFSAEDWEEHTLHNSTEELKDLIRQAGQMGDEKKNRKPDLLSSILFAEMEHDPYFGEGLVDGHQFVSLLQMMNVILTDIEDDGTIKLNLYSEDWQDRVDKIFDSLSEESKRKIKKLSDGPTINDIDGSRHGDIKWARLWGGMTEEELTKFIFNPSDELLDDISNRILDRQGGDGSVDPNDILLRKNILALSGDEGILDTKNIDDLEQMDSEELSAGEQYLQKLASNPELERRAHLIASYKRFQDISTKILGDRKEEYEVIFSIPSAKDKAEYIREFLNFWTEVSNKSLVPEERFYDPDMKDKAITFWKTQDVDGKRFYVGNSELFFQAIVGDEGIELGGDSEKDKAEEEEFLAKLPEDQREKYKEAFGSGERGKLEYGAHYGEEDTDEERDDDEGGDYDLGDILGPDPDEDD